MEAFYAEKITLIATSAVLCLSLIPAVFFARQNSLIGGVSVSYDYSKRSYESIEDDPDTVVNEAGLNDGRKDDLLYRVAVR